MTRMLALSTAAALTAFAGAASAQEKPPYWRINVHSTLSVHAEPSTYSPSFAQLRRGMIVRNLGCAEDMGRMWCQVPIAPNDGASIGWVAMDFLLPADGPGETVDHATQNEPTTKSIRVHFNPGATADLESGQLSSGNSVRYVLGAKNGQTLEVSFDQADPGLEYRIIMPNGHVLLDPVATTLPYQGQLYMSGDHMVEIINRGHHKASYAVYVQVH